MPLFYFNIYNDDITPDDSGIDLASPEAARERAILEARELAMESIKMHGHLILDHHIDVLDTHGELVVSISFEDAIDIRPTLERRS